MSRSRATTPDDNLLFFQRVKWDDKLPSSAGPAIYTGNPSPAILPQGLSRGP